MFNGNLRKISLSEVLRLLSMSSQTGALVVDEEGFTGMVFLQVGQIVHAATDGLEGIDALNKLTQHRQANFTFNEGFTTPTLSLAEYPSALLIEKLKKQIDELKAREEAIPTPQDLPVYLREKSVLGLVVRPDELNLLLLADGSHSVAEIALTTGRELNDVLLTMGKFRHAGVIEIQTRPATPATPVITTTPLPPAAPIAAITPETILLEPTPPPAEAPRYWRGKRIN